MLPVEAAAAAAVNAAAAALNVAAAVNAAAAVAANAAASAAAAASVAASAASAAAAHRLKALFPWPAAGLSQLLCCYSKPAAFQSSSGWASCPATFFSLLLLQLGRGACRKD